MSSKNNHIIDRNNYEEYFILYMDNELSAEQALMVEDFLAANPDLQVEMDLLTSTKLSLDDIKYPSKEELFAYHMKKETVDETLLLYIDNELNEVERKNTEIRIQTDKEFNLEHSLLLQVKLDATEVILYPNKKELYRHAEKVVVFRPWMRVAVAVVILLFGSLYFISENYTPEITPVVANNTSKKVVQPIISSKPISTPSEERPVAVTEQIKEEKVTNKFIAKDQDEVEQKSRIANVRTPHIEKSTVASVDAIPLLTNEQKVVLNNAFTESLNTSVVTSGTPVSYNNSEDPQITDVDVEETKTRKGSIKGFLRKATRLIERNTGIGTVSDDDELLIGAIAVKLK